MFDAIDEAYFERRAREERQREISSRDTSAVLVHRQLAEQYELRLGELRRTRSRIDGRRDGKAPAAKTVVISI